MILGVSSDCVVDPICTQTSYLVTLFLSFFSSFSFSPSLSFSTLFNGPQPMSSHRIKHRRRNHTDILPIHPNFNSRKLGDMEIVSLEKVVRLSGEQIQMYEGPS